MALSLINADAIPTNFFGKRITDSIYETSPFFDMLDRQHFKIAIAVAEIANDFPVMPHEEAPAWHCIVRDTPRVDLFLQKPEDRG